MNSELSDLHSEDRHDAQTFRGDEAFISSQARRWRVERILLDGGVSTAEDFFHASFVFQHGERLEHWAQAHLLARTAADMGYPGARYQAAAAYDRWLLRQGRPQKYGTNSLGDGNVVRVWDYDPATTDAERADWEVPPLAELHARAAHVSDNTDRSGAPEPVVTVEVAGLQIDLFDEEAQIPSDRPIYGVHSYYPIMLADPTPGFLPIEATLWRFGALFCAKGPSGEVIYSWHRCNWQVRGDDGSKAPLLFEELRGQVRPLNPAGAFWGRVALAIDAGKCWLVGGVLRPDELEQIARSL